ncbi:MAG: helix-turn-helix domain-containing protein [Actinobacteria bacterium]|nr:helix-turn-helix domain-containing protein [Actinomycetota bacterium]
MSYGHADKIARLAASTPAAGSEKPAPLIDPTLYHRDDVRPVLAERDIAGLFRVLKDDAGLTQRTIAELVGMSQSEVSEILDGRRVIAYDVLVRIAEGLRITRELMGLSYGENDAYGGDGTVANPPEGVSVEMLRRRLIELGAGLAVAAPAAKLAPLLERLELPDPPPVPPPSVLSGVHVVKVRDLTRRAYGSDPEVSSAAAAWASRRQAQAVEACASTSSVNSSEGFFQL